MFASPLIDLLPYKALLLWFSSVAVSLSSAVPPTPCMASNPTAARVSSFEDVSLERKSFHSQQRPESLPAMFLKWFKHKTRHRKWNNFRAYHNKLFRIRHAQQISAPKCRPRTAVSRWSDSLVRELHLLVVVVKYLERWISIRTQILRSFVF